MQACSSYRFLCRISVHNFIALDTSARAPESSLSPTFLIQSFWSIGRFDFPLRNPQVFQHLIVFPTQHCFRPSFCLCQTFWLVSLFKPAFIMLINSLPWGTWIGFCLFSSSSACWSPNGQLFCSLRDSSVPPLCAHAPINYLHDSRAYLLQAVMQILPDFCVETFHLHLLSQVFYYIFDTLHCLPFSLLSTLFLCSWSS